MTHDQMKDKSMRSESNSIWSYLATFPIIHITEAYTQKQIGSVQVDEKGYIIHKQSIKDERLHRLKPRIETHKIAEIRIRANENPEIYYEL